jgi:Domain of unknown function (DUF4307)
MTSRGNAGGPEQWPEHIRARYGVTGRPPWLPALVALLLVGGTIVSGLLVWQLATPVVSAGVTSYTTVSDDHMDIRYQVLRRDEVAVTCVLRARAGDGYDVGYATVELPAASGRTQHELQMRTAYRGFVGELLGCGEDGPPPGIPGAQFRPGVDPPAQPWAPDSP